MRNIYLKIYKININILFIKKYLHFNIIKIKNFPINFFINFLFTY